MSDQKLEIREQWEKAGPGWARWEPVLARWMAPATEAMLEMARVGPGCRVLDLACGAGNQTLLAAERVGGEGAVVASDIAQVMLDHVSARARERGLDHVSARLGAAEDLDVEPGSFDACICQLGLMLFVDPASALRAVRRALRPGGRVAAVVFTTRDMNPFMATPLRIMLRHTGKAPPGPGQPGIFALAGEGVLEGLLEDAGFEGIEQRRVRVSLELESARETVAMMKDAFGIYRAIVADAPEPVRAAAWAEVGGFLETLEDADGFHGPGEVLVACGVAGAAERS